MAKYIYNEKKGHSITLRSPNSPGYHGTHNAGSPGNQRPLLSGLDLLKLTHHNPDDERIRAAISKRDNAVFTHPAFGKVSWDHA